jgi:hypothetical protein
VLWLVGPEVNPQIKATVEPRENLMIRLRKSRAKNFFTGRSAGPWCRILRSAVGRV